MMIKLSYIILFPLRLIEPLLDKHTLVIVTRDYGIFMNVFWETGVLIPSVVLESSMSQLTVAFILAFILFVQLSNINSSSGMHLKVSEKSLFSTMELAN